MEGYMELWQGVFSRWAGYYFRIHEDILLFGPKREEIQFKVHMKIAKIITTIDDPICLILHTGTETLYLRANSIDERVKWYKKLKSVQHELDNADYAK